MNRVSWVIRWVMALLLAVAAGLKIGGSPGSQTLLGSLPVALQWGVVAAELGLAAWLVSGAYPRPAAYAALTLFSIFLATILINLNSPAPKDCGCFGKMTLSDDISKNLHIMLGVDSGLLALALAAYYLPVNKPQA